MLVFFPSPFGRDLIHENGQTYYEHYEANCREAERARTTIQRSLKDASTHEKQAEAERAKSDNEEEIARECDMAAQYLAAESAASMDSGTWVMMYATIAGVMLLFFTLLYTRKTLKEAGKTTREAARSADFAARAVTDAREHAVMEFRAYVHIAEATMRRENHDVRLSLRVTNAGATPASNCVLRFSLIRFNRQFAELGSQHIEDYETYTDYLFSRDSLLVNYALPRPDDPAQWELDQHIIVGTVGYRDQFEYTPIRVTSFSFMVDGLHMEEEVSMGRTDAGESTYS